VLLAANAAPHHLLLEATYSQEFYSSSSPSLVIIIDNVPSVDHPFHKIPSCIPKPQTIIKNFLVFFDKTNVNFKEAFIDFE
jgi:hypothetical protein